MMTRPTSSHAIVRARRTNRISIASPGDFVLGQAEAVMSPSSSVFPYCLDFLRARAIYVCGVNGRELMAAPFYYLHARRHATSIISVPIERGRIVESDAGANPIFLFSPGRCGSTLLCRVMFEAGIACVSEPDFYTQMSSVFWSARHNPLRATFRAAVWNMTDDLVAALGARTSPVVKLRAESCRAPELFLRGTDAQPRTLVMLREFEAWARSTRRTFRGSAGKSVRKYLRALRALAYLSRNTTCLVVNYENLEADAAGTCRTLGAFLGVEVPEEAVLRAKQYDSQGETPLERGARRDPPGWERGFDATMRLWRSPRVARILERLGAPGGKPQADGLGKKSLQAML